MKINWKRNLTFKDICGFVGSITVWVIYVEVMLIWTGVIQNEYSNYRTFGKGIK